MTKTKPVRAVNPTRGPLFERTEYHTASLHKNLPTITCPTCNGEGKVVDMPRVAYELRYKHEYKYRKIAKLMKFKHPGSVSDLIRLFFKRYGRTDIPPMKGKK